MLAERDDREAARRLARSPLRDDGGQRTLETAVGEIGQVRRQSLERDKTGEIADAERRRQGIALAPERSGEIRCAFPGAASRFNRSLDISGGKWLSNVGKTVELELQIRRMLPRAGKRLVYPFFTLCLIHTTGQISSVGAAQQLKLPRSRRVLAHVNTINPRREAMVQASSRRFVKVAPPTVHTGVGNALRQAYAMDGEIRSLKMFEELLARLDHD